MNISTVPAHQVITPPPTPAGESPVDLHGVVVVGVDGDVDIATAPQLLKALQAVLAAPAARPLGGMGAGCGPRSSGEVTVVIVDLTEVEFIDSAAIGVLVQGHHLARRSGRCYALVATHPMIHALFEVTGLAKVLPLHPDATAAVRSVGPAAVRPSAER